MSVRLTWERRRGRRRPSLADVLGGDPNDPSVQVQMAQKLHEAAMAQAASANEGRRRRCSCWPGDGTAVQQEDGASKHRKDDDRLQLIIMPVLIASVFLVFVVLWGVRGDFTENVINCDVPSIPEPEPEPEREPSVVEGEPMQHYSLNEPLGAFIGVVSIIYALLYTSVYNDATERANQIRNSLALEAGGVHTAMLLVRTLDADDDVNKVRALVLFSE